MIKFIRLLAVTVAALFLCQVAFATASVRQEHVSAWTSAGSTSVNTTFSSAALTGDTIEVWVIWAGTTNPTVTDSAAQSYSFKTSAFDSNDGITLALFLFQNNASASALTVTATWGSAQGYNGIWIKELTGVTSAPYQASHGQNQCPSGCTATAGTGTGAITSGNATPTAQPALVSALSWGDITTAGSVVAGSLVAGTTGWNLDGTGPGPTGTSGSQRITSTSPIAATFTNTTDGGTRHFLTLESVYTESSSGCTHAGRASSGGTAVPNGTTGSYWLKTGSFGTPDCSTINYWQPAVGNFGVN